MTAKLFHVHKNTKDRRNRHQVARQFMDGAKSLNQDKAIRGYVIVAWTDEFDARCDWHLDKVESSRSTPERIKRAFIDALAETKEQYYRASKVLRRDCGADLLPISRW